MFLARKFVHGESVSVMRFLLNVQTIGFALLLVSVAIAEADTRYVSSKGKDSGNCSSPCATIAYAVSQAKSGDTIDVDEGTYTESGIFINKDLIIRGVSKNKTIVQAATQKGTANDRVFNVDQSVQASIENLTVQYGKASLGGGIYIGSKSVVRISETTISDNSASGGDGMGGGVCIKGSASVTIEKSTISNNSTSGKWSSGGGISGDCYATLKISASTISSNSAPFGQSGGGAGGGIYTSAPFTLIIDNSTISKNNADCGGGIDNGGKATITKSIISDNSVYRRGGGIFNASSKDTLKISESTFSGNGAQFGGDAIYNLGYGPVTINDSTFSKNSVTGSSGSAFENTNTIANFPVSITNSTFSENGGRAISNSGTLTLSNSTIYKNDLGISNAGTLNIKNSIVADNGKDCGYGSFQGVVTKVSGVSLDTDKSCNGFTHVTSAQLDLGPLKHNLPGSTSTHAIPASSVAVDAATECTDYDGKTITTDQRGVARPQPSGGKCDIGAYEYDSSTYSSTFTPGDLNYDNIVNVIDVRMIMRHADRFGLLTSQQLSAADWDGNGLVDTDDASEIAKVSIGQRGARSFTLAVQKTGAGEGELRSTPEGIDCGKACEARLASGSVVVLEATPTKRSGAVEWQGCDLITKENRCTVKMDRDKHVAAAFHIQDRQIPLTGPDSAFLRTGAPHTVSGSTIVISSASVPRGMAGPLSITVKEITAGGGVAAIQGRIIYDPTLIQIEHLRGMNGFSLKAFNIDNKNGELRFALVKSSDGGLTDGPVASMIVKVSDSGENVTWLSWEGNFDSPNVVGGDNNQELTGINYQNGQVNIR